MAAAAAVPPALTRAAAPLLAAALGLAAPPAAADPPACPPGQRERPWVADGLAQGTARWRLEAQDPRTRWQAVPQGAGLALELHAPAGATLWFDTPLRGDYVLRFTATPLPAPAEAGSLAGRVSDLNLFWNATEPDGSPPRPRDGRFASYDSLRAHYVGFGANGNTTTRLRRYHGHAAAPGAAPERELLDGWADPPEATPADRRGPMTEATRLVAGQPVAVQLLSRRPTPGDPAHLRWWAQGRLLFEQHAGEPLLQGHVALRTTASAWRLSRWSVFHCENP